MEQVWDQGADSPRTFREDLEAHLYSETGFVYSTPDYFMMGRPVLYEADARLILDPTHEFLGEVDAWWIYGLAGDFKMALEACPYYLPLIGFERRDTIKWWVFEELFSKKSLLQSNCNRL